MKTKGTIVAIILALPLGMMSACSGSDSTSAKITIKVAMRDSQQPGLPKVMEKAKAKLEAAHSNVTVDIQKISGTSEDYINKLNLMRRSADTAPDVETVDSYLVSNDIKAGYLKDIEDNLQKWPDWQQWPDAAKDAAKGADGHHYGILESTDSRFLWVNKDLLAKAGIKLPFQPKSWQEVLDAARAVKTANPGVVPLNVYAGTATGEASSMQGFEMLLSGTDHWLVNTSGKWVLGSQGFRDSLTFLQTIYKEGLAPSPAQALNKEWPNSVGQDFLPKAKLAMALDGNWVASNWKAGAKAPWPDWSSHIDFVKWPTQNGQGTGFTTLAGGWTQAVDAKSQHPDLAFEFITYLLGKDLNTEFCITDNMVPVRQDVAQDPAVLKGDASSAFAASVVPSAKFRPTADGKYDQVSLEIQKAQEAVITGKLSVDAAAKAYDAAVKGIVGADNTVGG